MSCTVLKRRDPTDERAVSGREYFDEWARRLGLEKLDPDAIQELPPQDLKHGSVESRLGGRITRDLTRLSPEETARRRELSEEFLKQPAEQVPGEDEESPDS